MTSIPHSVGNNYKIDTKYGGWVHISFPLFHRVLHMVIPFSYTNTVMDIISHFSPISKLFRLVQTFCESFHSRTVSFLPLSTNLSAFFRLVRTFCKSSHFRAVSFLRSFKENEDGFLSHHGIVWPLQPWLMRLRTVPLSDRHLSPRLPLMREVAAEG